MISGHTTFEKIISLNNLFFAWQNFSAGKMLKDDVLRFAQRLEDNVFELHDELASGNYRHGSYHQFYIHDPKRRFISCATVRDRVVHQAVVQVLEPVVEPTLIYDSYASRRGKGTHAAALRLDRFLRQASRNYRCSVFILKCDIRKFFDSIRHDTMLALLRRKIYDHKVIGLIREIVGSYTTDCEQMRGLPLGNVTSQLFANIYLSGFDHFMKERLRARWYIRFCDDFVVVHPDRAFLEKLTESAAGYLRHRLSLMLHPKKTSLRKFSYGCDFVGQVLRPHYRFVRTTTRRRLLRSAKERIHRYRSGLIEMENLRSSLQSWFGALCHGSNQGVAQRMREIIGRTLFGY